MAYRAAVAALVACCALPAPASAAECVRVVVDYGTVDAQAPSGSPNTTCVAVAEGANAATALHERAKQLGLPSSKYPRYDGNFLCGIDGYPETGCGYRRPNPYWSLWWWAGGKWVYSSFGMTDLTVADRDRDGHPDPLGFRFLDSEGAHLAPRANPSYPKPATTRPAPPRTSTAPPPVARTSAPAAAATGGPGTAAATTPPATTPAGTPTPSATRTTPAPSGSTTPEPTATALPDPRGDGEGGGFPVGTAAGGILAAGLLAAAALRFRRAP